MGKSPLIAVGSTAERNNMKLGLITRALKFHLGVVKPRRHFVKCNDAGQGLLPPSPCVRGCAALHAAGMCGDFLLTLVVVVASWLGRPIVARAAGVGFRGVCVYTCELVSRVQS